MKFFAHSRVLLLVLTLVVCVYGSYFIRRASGAVVTQGGQRLTEEQFDNFVFYWETHLDIKLTRDEREELKRDVLQYWTTNNTTEIQNTLKQAEDGAAIRELPQSALADMRTAYQAQHLAGLRSEPNDPMSVLLLKIYNRVHGFGGGGDKSPAAGAVLAQGNPPLTEGIVARTGRLWEFLLDLKLTAEQRERLRRGMVEIWKKNDPKEIQSYLDNFNMPEDQLKQLRDNNQAVVIFVQAFRRASEDPVSRVLVEAYDQAHPEMREATRAKGFADLVGTWEWDDALLQERDPYSGSPQGIGYVEAGKVEIAPDGQFKLIRTHRHCEGACCNEQGKSESGIISVEDGELVFQIKSGTEMSRDGCNARLNQQVAIKPHRESYSAWSITSNPVHNNAPTLCWNTSQTEATCYIKRQ